MSLSTGRVRPVAGVRPGTVCWLASASGNLSHGVEEDHLTGCLGEPRRQAASSAHHGHPDAMGGEVCGLLGEQVITGPDRHMREPVGDILVPQHVQQGQVGAIGTRPNPVVGMRPAERRVQQCQMA